MNGRLVENASLTSFNLIVNDETGIGKDWITTNVGESLPEKDFIKRTRTSEKLFTYWHNPKFDPEWTWNGKVFYNEDISQNVLNSDVFKVMASSGSNATVLVNQTPVDIPINGKPIIIATTESSTPNRENIRRFALVNLDSTIDQTHAIMIRQAELKQSGKTTDYDPVVIKALGKLKRVKVRVPYAVKLEKYFPKKKVLMRTQFNRFLDWISSITAFYQFQRKQDKEKFYLATSQDYEIAKECFEKTISNPLMIPLTKQQQNILSRLDGFPHFIEDIAIMNPEFSESWLRKQLDKLTEYGFLKKDKQQKGESDKWVFTYQKEELEELKLPNWKNMKDMQEKDKSNNTTNRIIEKIV
jgi:DNA-binding HxlR family transcriptional regulator